MQIKRSVEIRLALGLGKFRPGLLVQPVLWILRPAHCSIEALAISRPGENNNRENLIRRLFVNHNRPGKVHRRHLNCPHR